MNYIDTTWLRQAIERLSRSDGEDEASRAETELGIILGRLADAERLASANNFSLVERTYLDKRRAYYEADRTREHAAEAEMLDADSALEMTYGPTDS